MANRGTQHAPNTWNTDRPPSKPGRLDQFADDWEQTVNSTIACAMRAILFFILILNLNPNGIKIEILVFGNMAPHTAGKRVLYVEGRKERNWGDIWCETLRRSLILLKM